MYISWFGQSCFKIQGQEVIIITDPLDPKIGLKQPRLSADIITVSYEYFDYNNIKAIKGIIEKKPFIINQPGEYEIRNVFIYGISCFRDNQKDKLRNKNIIYRIELDNINIIHLGNLAQGLSNGQLEELGEVDVLMIPIGGNYTIDAKEATRLISQIEPRIVIPMHYKIKGLKINIASINKFCQEIGICPKESIKKLKINKKDLISEEMNIIVLQP